MFETWELLSLQNYWWGIVSLLGGFLAMMLFVHVKDQFQDAAYWTGETFIDPDDPEDTAWAWYQNFDNGNQYNLLEGFALRARAVRRLPI